MTAAEHCWLPGGAARMPTTQESVSARGGQALYAARLPTRTACHACTFKVCIARPPLRGLHTLHAATCMMQKALVPPTWVTKPPYGQQRQLSSICGPRSRQAAAALTFAVPAGHINDPHKAHRRQRAISTAPASSAPAGSSLVTAQLWHGSSGHWRTHARQRRCTSSHNHRSLLAPGQTDDDDLASYEV